MASPNMTLQVEEIRRPHNPLVFFLACLGAIFLVCALIAATIVGGEVCRAYYSGELGCQCQADDPAVIVWETQVVNGQPFEIGIPGSVYKEFCEARKAEPPKSPFAECPCPPHKACCPLPVPIDQR